ncbi:MAG: hypothetical protein BWY15_01977 [Firmicutes bacterium ADurb.Bin193]|nr:MAG: hypothetical protein BWY15_01977 [Firmicutes bacterium ADurb.Bin193]
MSNKNLAAKNNGYMTLADVNIGDMIAEELDGLEVSFEKIKIPSAGSTFFEIEDENGESAGVAEFSGVIVYQHPLHCYYKTKYTGGNNPPDCGSFDGVNGIGDPGGLCKRCPYNEFGSAENGAKACKNRRRIYVLREGELFPLLLSLPTGSLKEFTKYLKRLLSKGKKSNMVVTSFSLKKATNAGGVTYSQAHFAVSRDLSNDEQTLIGKLTEQIKALSGKVGFETDNEPISVDPETGEVIEPLSGDSDV